MMRQLLVLWRNQTGVVFIYKETNGTWSELLTPFNTNGTDTRSGATSLDFIAMETL